jgi:hypothetical protein
MSDNMHFDKVDERERRDAPEELSPDQPGRQQSEAEARQQTQDNPPQGQIPAPVVSTGAASGPLIAPAPDDVAVTAQGPNHEGGYREQDYGGEPTHPPSEPQQA